MRFTICEALGANLPLMSFCKFSTSIEWIHADCWKNLFMDIANFCVPSSAPVPCASNALFESNALVQNHWHSIFLIARYHPVFTECSAKRLFLWFFYPLKQEDAICWRTYVTFLRVHVASAFNLVAFYASQNFNIKNTLMRVWTPNYETSVQCPRGKTWELADQFLTSPLSSNIRTGKSSQIWASSVCKWQNTSISHDSSTRLNYIELYSAIYTTTGSLQ